MALDGKNTSGKLGENHREMSDWQPCRLRAAMFNNGVEVTLKTRGHFSITARY